LKKLKIFNDPIYGFITIPNELIFNIIAHPYFQRLRRISQMGLSSLVFPGAKHTRFHHALGCTYLMEKAIYILRYKGVSITHEEKYGLIIAILLHDIGHGPFSHALENNIVGISHEEISLKFMEQMNIEFDGKLTMAIDIFKGIYPKKFFHQLISSQLDIDRLDYLKRDSFYTGVAEGNINSLRLISMFNVVNNELVIEEKGIYSVEKFITARRLMYWQVYLHKTGIVAEQLLISILQRAKELINKGENITASTSLSYFLTNSINNSNFNKNVLNTFSNLDDYDVFASIKEWTNHSDTILSYLSNSLINRRLPKIEIKKIEFSLDQIQQKMSLVKKDYNISADEIKYYVTNGTIENQAYNTEENIINILLDDGTTADVAEVSDYLNIQTLSKKVTKYYLYYPKEASKN